MRTTPFDGFVKRDGPLEVFYPRNADAAAVTSASTAATLATYAATNRDADKNVGDVDANHWRSQGFKVTSSGNVSLIYLYLKRVGFPGDNSYIEIQTDSGGLPSGTVVTGGTSSVLANMFSATTYANRTYRFPSFPALTAGTQYHLVLKRDDVDDPDNYIVWGADASSPSYADGTGEVYTLSTTTWSSEATDMIFTVYDDTHWDWTAYGTIVASTSADFIPTGVSISVQNCVKSSSNVLFWVEYELATGAAGSEVPFHRHTMTFSNWMTNPGATTINLATTELTIPTSPKVIPSGTRISHRIRVSAIAQDVYSTITTYIGGYEAAIPAHYSAYSSRAHLMGIHKGLMTFYPQGDSYIVVTPGNFPNYGTWVEVIASADHDLLICGTSAIIVSASAGAYGCYVEIGTGAAGSEVTRARIAHPSAATGSQVGLQYFDRRRILIKKGERVAIRATGTASPKNFKLLYEELNG